MLAVRSVEDFSHEEMEAIIGSEAMLQPLAEGQEFPGLGLFLLTVREGVRKNGLLRVLASLNAALGVALASPVVQFPDGQQAMTFESIAQFKAGVSAEAIARFTTDNGVVTIQELTWVAHTYIMRVDPGNRVPETANLYAESGLAHYAKPNWVRLPKTAVAPNDTRYPEQWVMENTKTNSPDGVGTSDADTDAEAAWDIHPGGPDIVVAIGGWGGTGSRGSGQQDRSRLVCHPS
jgi:hypothetical protein